MENSCLKAGCASVILSFPQFLPIINTAVLKYLVTKSLADAQVKVLPNRASASVNVDVIFSRMAMCHAVYSQ